MTYDVYLWCQIWYQIWPNHPKLQPGTTNINQVWFCSRWTSIHARELKLGHNSRITYYCDPWCQSWHQRWFNPPDLQSGTINVFQVWQCSWCTYIHARELKIGIQIKNFILWWSMMSKTTEAQSASFRHVFGEFWASMENGQNGQQW